MALRWIEGFETWGNVTDERDVWGDHFYGKYGMANCDSGTPSLVEGYRGIGLGYANANLSSNYFTVPLDIQATWTIGFAWYLGSSVTYFGESLVKLRDQDTVQLWLEVQRDMGGGTAGTHEILLFRGGTQLASLGYYAQNQWLDIELQATINGLL